MSSITGLNGSRRVGRGGSFLRGSGKTEATAFFTVSKTTLYLRTSSRIYMPML
ncbi:hypothetical protein SAURM35S_03924 [Streptomyces aurantiogriseus]